MRALPPAVWAYCAAIALAVTGCNRPATLGRHQPAVSVTAAVGPTPLRLACDPLDESALREALELWEAQRPDVPVVLEAMSVAKPVPDMSVCGPERFRHWLHEGELLDLTPFVVRDRYDVGDFDWRILELFKWDDRLYGLPAEAGAEVLYYNADLFRAHQVAPPGPDWEWDDFLGAARALTRDIDGDGLADQYGFLCTGGASGQWIPWVWAAGGRVLDPSGTRSLIDQPAAVEGIRFYADLLTRERVALPLWEGSDGTWLGEDLFATGRVAMCAGPPELGARGRGFPHLNWAIAPLPKGPSARATRLAARAYVVSARTDRPDDAWELAKFLATPAVESLMARHYKVPPRPSMMLAGPVLRTQPLWDEDVFAQAIREARMEPLVAAGRPVRNLVGEEFDRLLRAQTSPEEAAAQMHRRIEEGLRAAAAA